MAAAPAGTPPADRKFGSEVVPARKSGNITAITDGLSIGELIASVNLSNIIVTPTWPGLDELDFRIIALLQQDGRASFARMAQALGSAVATVRQRYERLAREGYIRTVALVDPARLGRGVVSHLEIGTVGEAEQVVDHLRDVDEIAWLAIGLDYQTVYAQLSTASNATLVALLNERIRPAPGIASISSSIQLRSWSPTFRYAGSPIPVRPEPAGEEAPWAGNDDYACVDDIDRGLLECLEMDARMTVTAMTERVGLSVPATRQRLMKLLANGTARIRVRPDPLSDKIMPIRLNIFIDCDSSLAAQRLAALPHVTYIMESTGPAILRMELLCFDEAHLRSSYLAVCAVPGVAAVEIVRYARVILHAGHW